MNSQPKRIDNLSAQLDARADRQHRAREHEPVGPVLAEMSVTAEDPPGSTALAALLRNSLASEAAPGQVNLAVKIAPVGVSLERDGCDYVHVALRLLQYYGCPPETRLFILAVCALSNGDAESLHVITDEMLAEVIGYKRHSIKPMREALAQWMQETKYAFIDIVEGERDRVTKKYVPTQYRARVVRVIGQYVRDARALHMRSQRAAIKMVTSKEHEDLLERAVRDTPTAPLVHRREERRGFAPSGKSPAERQIEMTYSRMERLVEGVNDLLGTFLMNGTDPWTVRDEMVRRIDDNIRRITATYPEYQRAQKTQ